MAKRMKIEQLQPSSSWSNLPEDMIILILNRLYYIDQICFRAVCRSWREANIQGIKSVDKFPWNMAMDPPFCYLYDPTYKKTHMIKIGTSSSEIFTDAVVMASKYGWILFSNESLFFFYSPFTNQIVPLLPDLPRSIDYTATFTAPPDSSVCEIYAVQADWKEISLYMGRPGDTTWTKLIKIPSPYFAYDYIQRPNIEYVDRTIYITYHLTAVFAFNTILKDMKIYPYPPIDDKDDFYPYPPIDEEEDDFCFGADHLIELDGNLLLFVGCGDPCRGVWQAHLVFRLDQEQERWIRVKYSNNISVFLNDYTSFILPVDDEQSDLANTIHSDPCPSKLPCSQLSQIYNWGMMNLYPYQIQNIYPFLIQLPKLR